MRDEWNNFQRHHGAIQLPDEFHHAVSGAAAIVGRYLVRAGIADRSPAVFVHAGLVRRIDCPRNDLRGFHAGFLDRFGIGAERFRDADREYRSDQSGGFRLRYNAQRDGDAGYGFWFRYHAERVQDACFDQRRRSGKRNRCKCVQDA